MSRKPFLVGDFRSNTGPAIANAALKKALGKRAKYSFARTRIGRILELIVKTPFSSTVCFCGFSMLNVYGIKIARFFRKKIVYLMHGYIEVEEKINHISPKPKRVAAEHYIHENVDILICVSELLANEIKKKYPSRENVYVVYNIVESINNTGDIEKDPRLVFSTGGGMPRKNNLAVCEAIKNVNDSLPADGQLKYIIAGKSYGHEKEFEKYDFVKFVDDISYEECSKLMKKSSLYIQNSLFETFGLAVIEAIGCDCDVILSKWIGALEVISGLGNDDVAENPDDVNELSRKILAKVKDGKRFSGTVKWSQILGDSIAKRFLRILEGSNEK